jgi:hypothetical protein
MVKFDGSPKDFRVKTPKQIAAANVLAIDDELRERGITVLSEASRNELALTLEIKHELESK